jgi:RNA polymerase sigma-70 factor, ECF subfamily
MGVFSLRIVPFDAGPAVRFQLSIAKFDVIAMPDLHFRDLFSSGSRPMIGMTMSNTTPDDSNLVPRLQRGEDTAFEELVRTHGSRLLRVARRLLSSEEDARDAVQDAFVGVFKSIGTFESASTLSTWLHRIVVNACLMRLRTKRRKPEEDIEQYLPRFLADGHQVESSVRWSESAENVLERSELRELVRKSINELPDSYRSVLMMRDIEELSTEEVASMLGTTANAVKIRLHRARQALRALLDPHFRPAH